MDQYAIESTLREKLPMLSIQELEGFPADNYTNFIKHYNNGIIHLLTAYDPNAFTLIATRAELIMHYFLTGSPALISVILIVTSIVQGNIWLLLGIPLAFLGFAFTIPGLMRSIGYILLLIVVGLAIYNWFRGFSTVAYILSAYAVSNILVYMARLQCSMTLIDAALKSEIILVWLYMKGSLLIENK